MPSDKCNTYQRWNVNQLMNDPHRTWRSWCRSIGYIARGSRALQDPRVGSRSSRDNVGNPVDYACTMLSYGAVKSLPLSPSLYTLSSATFREKYLLADTCAIGMSGSSRAPSRNLHRKGLIDSCAIYK
uniref:Uncharacterized protein n=1 Tax=Vespula pensylvanica TaxID=30213 RepID=A0A834KCM3_VESPE|nr:hypothetical protein H0235_014921 [Vespula pensylvanica]